MIPEQIGWLLVLVLIVLPVAAAGLLRLGFRSRGRVEGGWGGALAITLCWIVALVIILMQVRT